MTDTIPSNVADILAETNLHTSPERHAAMHPGEEMARARAVLARGKLDDYVRTRSANGRAAARRVFAELPTDALVPTARLAFAADDRGVRVSYGDSSLTMHRHAWGQLAGRLGIPLRYLDGLASTTGWQRDFAAATLNEHAIHSGERYLVRSVGGEVRGVLSDRYRRLDSRPMLEAFLAESEACGMVIADGRDAGVRTMVRVIDPTPIELTPGEWGVLGLGWGNSDYGAGAHTCSVDLLKLTCLNGAIGQSALRTVHSGGRIDDVTSQRTVDLDTAAQASLVRDVVRAFARDGAGRAQALDQIRAAAAKTVKGDPIKGRLLTGMSKTEQARVRELFDGPEVEMIPAGRTAWRLSNTVSWLANEADDVLRSIELERLAGQILEARTTRSGDDQAAETYLAATVD